MIRYIRDLRLIPIALIASACLLTLKIADIALNGASLFAPNDPALHREVSVTRAVPDATVPADSKLSWAQQMFNFPGGSGPPPVPSLTPIVPRQIVDRDNADITGSVPSEPAAKNAGAPPARDGAEAKAAPTARVGKDPKAAAPASGTVIPTEGVVLPSGAERAILERLQQRRQELDERAHELDLRESLIQGAEKRMDAKIAELKQVEEQIKAATQKKEDADKAQLKGLVTMYENMKPRDAAKIFNGLDTNVLIEVASAINPRTMADIVAQMQPDVAEHLTVELANRSQQHGKAGDAGAANLPKIEGQPATQ